MKPRLNHRHRMSLAGRPTASGAARPPESLRELLRQAGDHRPVLAAPNAPAHVGLCASKAHPGELTVDLVHYRHDLATDRLTPVTAGDFTVTLQVPQWNGAGKVTVKSIRYDESAPDSAARQLLADDALSLREGTITLRVLPFTHYQILQPSPAQP